MRIIAQFKKIDGARYISHLDLQRAVQRALRRSGLPVKFTEGFSPHQVLSFASALSLGFTSLGEVMDVAMTEPVTPEAFEQAMGKQMPPSLALVSAAAVEDNYPGLMALVQSADYRVTAKLKECWEKEGLQARLAEILSQPVLAEKKTKAGIKEFAVNDQVLKLTVEQAEAEGEGARAVFFVRCDCAESGSLNPRLLFDNIAQRIGMEEEAEYCRLQLWADKDGTVPLWKVEAV